MKRNKQSLTLIVVVIITISFFALQAFTYKSVYTEKAKRSVVTDTLQNMVVFIIDDPVFEKGKMKEIGLYTLDSIGWGRGFGVTLPVQKRATSTPLLLLQPNATQTPFFIYPHEKINIRYAATDTMQMYIAGNATRSNELNFFRKLVQKTGVIYYSFSMMPYHRVVKSVEQVHRLEKTIDSVKSNRLQFLALYNKQYPLSSDFTKIAKNCIESVSIDDSLLLYQSNSNMLKKANLYTPFARAKVTSINRIGFEPYPMFLQACKHLAAMATGTNPQVINDIKADVFLRRFNFIAHNFLGDTRNFLLANTLNNVHHNKVAISKAMLDRFDRECTSKGYRDMIHRILRDDAKAPGTVAGVDKLLALDGKTMQDLSAVIAQHQGKLILLDFWASWCWPCRSEMPASILLKQKYKGKNVAFLSISTDDHIADWLKAAKEEGMTLQNDFLLLNAKQADILTKYKINAIPRYLLLGKDGKILFDDAPRPSDQDLTKLIDKYL